MTERTECPSRLTVTRVREVASDCLFRAEEIVVDDRPPVGAVEVDGIIARYAFHPERLASHRDDVASMLAELPDTFMADKGGGWSFLQACMTRSGMQWGQYHDMAMLFALGTACGFCSYAMPREFWAALPGGVPYIIVDLSSRD